MASVSSPIDSSSAAAAAPAGPAPPPPSSRRLPPPCWSPEETVALIESYRDKWYSLSRSNLKVNHWQEVADAVAGRCPATSPPKTAVQCRHKMEKLRKRYRTELQRSRSMPVSRFSSSWVHFKLMDAMDKGPQPSFDDDDGDPRANNSDDSDEDEDELYGNARAVHKLYPNGIGASGGAGAGGFRIRIPTGVSVAQPGSKFYGKFDQKFVPTASPVPNYGSSPNFGARVSRDFGRPVMGMGKQEREGDPVTDMVAAIKVLGDGFVKMEQMKMETAREIETRRMDMEMKRTEMILESQERIVETFAMAVSEKRKKVKRTTSPES